MPCKTGLYRMHVREICRLAKRTPSELVSVCPPQLKDALGDWNGVLDSGVVRQIFAALGVQVRFHALAFVNLKGGVGKTTSALAVGTRAAQLGLRTCIVDMDAQASATLALGVDFEEEDFPVFYDVWQKPEQLLEAALVEIDDGLVCLPSSLQNSMLDVSLANPVAQKGAVAGVVDALRKWGHDLVVFDCPPSLGAAVISTICGVDRVVVPAACDGFSMRGIKLTCTETAAIRRTFGLPEQEIMILPTMLDHRKRLTDELQARLKAEYGARVLEPGIGTSSVMARELENRRTLFARGVHRCAVHDQYDQLVENLLELGMPCWKKESLT